MRQYELTQEAEQKAIRNHNNYLAQQDSVRTLNSSFGSILVEKSALKLKYDELSQDNKDLIDRLELANNKKPSVIIQTEIVYRDTGIAVPTSTVIKDSTKLLIFKHEPKLPGNNFLSLTGQIPYRIVTDSLHGSKNKSGLC
jgi:cell shape-determining protein MreC